MDRKDRLAIIFDFGNVLLDWDPRYLYRKIFQGDDEAMERFLEEIRFFEWNQLQDEGRPFNEAVAELSARFPAYAEYIRAYDERYPESLSGPIWGTVEILKSLKEAGYALYGLSNWAVEKFLLVRPNYPFFDWFQDIILSGEVKLLKPDPRIFTLTLSRLGRQAQECLLIDDSQANIASAQTLGFQVIHFRSPEQLRSELERMGLLEKNGVVRG